MGSAGLELPIMHSFWKLVVSERWATSLTARNLPSCFHRAEEKSFQQMERRGSVDYTSQLEAASDGGDRGRGLERPAEFFLFSLSSIYQ